MKKAIISPKKHHAVIFDLDGVITKTASVHATAWKRLFDEFLKNHADTEGHPFEPFDPEADYLKYVDGKPRYEGIESFLKSREIEIPLGDPDDPPEQQTICGMGNKKNKMFVEELERSGVEVFPSSIELIKQLRKRGIKTALISSSKNCTPIINKVGAAHLFDAKIDGIDTAKMNIKGKPAPDIFLKAAEQLGVEPQHAVVVEDAISGVQAGRSGNFTLVIGVDRADQSDALLANGADVVVKDLEEVSIHDDLEVRPNALESLDEIRKTHQNKEFAIFLDYDGTLTPIVSHPDQAILGEAMHNTLKQLAAKYTVAIISGRDRPDVEKHVKIEDLFYAGSHGFDIAGPNDQHFEIDEGKTKLPALEASEKELREAIPQINGAWVERKKYSVAIHYRQVKPEKEEEVEKIVDEVHSHYYEDLRKTTGKKIFELQPNIPWNKGKALHWLLKLFKLDREDVIPIYLGDDVTDEDAFKALIDHGIGIVVQEEPKPTAAKYTLKDPDEVEKFLKSLLK
ncbi:MAG: putative glycosyl hydrolase [Chlamydiae bacterium]|nr:putative glycosyl hydrolase [Chlamydiota bacterium]